MKGDGNLVLIGMPGCGKSTLGKEAARVAGLPFIDTDALIEETQGRTIRTIFEQEGEEGFRRIETAVFRLLVEEGRGGAIVSAGGGVVTRPENLPLLRRLGPVVYIRRDVEAIAGGVAYGTDRPLLPDRGHLFALWEARRGLYEAWADRVFQVEEGESPVEAGGRIAELARAGIQKVTGTPMGKGEQGRGNRGVCFGVIGDPVEHSLSPALHGAVFETLGLEAVYEKVRVPPGALEDFAGKNSLRGYNVTIPHKESIIPFLDEVSGEARLAGAVNTVVREGGRQIGYNTDMEGLLRALRGNGTEYRDRVVCVFGTGGAARGVVCKAALEGAGEIRIFGRNGAKAAGIVRAAAGQGDPYRKEPLFRGLPSPEGVRGADIFINATPLGMAGFGEDFSSPGVSRQGVSTAFLEGLPDKALVYDCVYTPGETTLVKAARDRGLRAENGLSMLVWQGLLAEVFFGLADREAMLTKELYRAVYDRLEKLLYAPKGNKEEVNDPAKEKA